MDWEMICAVGVIIGIQGGILVAAAKSIFVTKKEHGEDIKGFTAKLYDDKSIPIFVPREEWEKSKNGRERRRDQSQRHLCEKMDKLQESQDKASEVLNKLLGRLGREN